MASRVAGAVSKIIGGGRGAPVVVLRSSGGARSATNDGSSAKKSAVATGLPVSGDDDPGLSLPKAPKRPLHVLGDGAPTQTVPARNADQSGAPTAVRFSRIVGLSVPTPPIAPDATGPAMKSLVAPPTPVVPSPPPDLGDILEEPHTHLVGVVAHVAGAVLNVVLTPFGPGSPAQSPVLWTVFAFVRNEFERPFLPTAASGQTTSSLNQSPNLLVNPGAEAGDPSLSGYSSVTVPGWTVTGTPTVIEYGTQRRLPWPLANPGPTAAGVSGVPEPRTAHPPGERQQFFGGGPVATSSLTQTVDLSAAASDIDAGTVPYTLSGDLGGFLMDPSAASVTVDFLDENEVHAGQRPASSRSLCLTAGFFTGAVQRDTSGTIPVGHPQRAGRGDVQRPQPGIGRLQQRLRRQPLVHRRRCAAHPAATHATGVEGRRARSRVHGLPGEQGFRTDIVGSPNAPYLNS